MYRVRRPGYRKDDQAMRWALPDRVFFACGACHILAHIFLQRHGRDTDQVLWIRPAQGHTGNHIVIARDQTVFDYHGYSDRGRFLNHTWRRARHFWPGWDAELIALPRAALVSEKLSRSFAGLWLREPGQFRHDPIPRAERFLDRFPAPPV